MSTVVGPFSVETDDLLAQAQAVAAAIPPAIAEMTPAGSIAVSSSNRAGAPSWAYGYTPSKSRCYWNAGRHAGAHEYAHAWWYRNGRKAGGNAALRALVDHPELLGKIENDHYTNRLSEAYAHAFAAAIGRPDGVFEGFFRVKIPATNYPALLDLMSKALAVATRPDHICRRPLGMLLRQLPQVDSPRVAAAAFGSEIRTAGGLSGGPYVLRDLDSGAGLQSSQWLAVLALDGHLIPQPAYTAALGWDPIPVQDPPAPAK